MLGDELIFKAPFFFLDVKPDCTQSFVGMLFVVRVMHGNSMHANHSIVFNSCRN